MQKLWTLRNSSNLTANTSPLDVLSICDFNTLAEIGSINIGSLFGFTIGQYFFMEATPNSFIYISVTGSVEEHRYKINLLTGVNTYLGVQSNLRGQFFRPTEDKYYVFHWNKRKEFIYSTDVFVEEIYAPDLDKCGREDEQDRYMLNTNNTAKTIEVRNSASVYSLIRSIPYPVGYETANFYHMLEDKRTNYYWLQGQNAAGTEGIIVIWDFFTEAMINSYTIPLWKAKIPYAIDNYNFRGDEALVLDPIPPGSPTTVSYNLKDYENGLFNMTPTFSVDGGVVWNPATIVGGSVINIPADNVGIDNSVLWDINADDPTGNSILKTNFLHQPNV